MLKVIFWQEQSRFEGGSVFERFAKVISNEEELSRESNENLFLRVIGDDGEDIKVDNVAFLETDDLEIEHNPIAMRVLKDLVRSFKIKPDVICATSLKRLFKTSKEVDYGELDLKVLHVDSQNEVLYYSKCGENDSTLLVGYGSQYEVT